MDDLLVTVKHLLDELNVRNDVCSRSDHLFQAESRQGLRDILNEYINNDGEDADSTYQLQQLEKRSNDWKQKGRKKGDYTYQPKGKPRVAKANAAVAILSNSPLHADSNTNEEAPTLSSADQRNLISLYYIHIRVPSPEEWNGEGGTMSKVVRKSSAGG